MTKWYVTMSIAGLAEDKENTYDTFEEAKAEQERLIKASGHGEDYWIICETEE